MLKIMTIFGTRPEAIKMAPVIQLLQEAAAQGQLQSIVCNTGQHRQMVDQVMALFQITPDVDLNLMQVGQTPAQVAARVLTQLEPILQSERPDWVLVQGDTTTVMATALTAYHIPVRIGHVEAGLRTGDRFSPFPEEMNRTIADHLSDLNFAPTERARNNLRREGIASERIRVTGNTVVDALLWAAKQPFDLHSLHLQSEGRKTILVTTHRRESFGAPLQQICSALRQLAQRRDVQLICPVHPNPNVAGPLREALHGLKNVKLIEPLDYLALVHLMKHSTLILTDSGGIQEEAPSLGVPVLVLRETTERPEAVEAGVVRVVGADTARILSECNRLLDDPAAYKKMAQAINPYGDGQAAGRIVGELVK